MPARAYRTRDLHDHLARQTTIPFDAARLRHVHPDWPVCSRCPYPLHPLAVAIGYTERHPICEERMQMDPHPFVLDREASRGSRLTWCAVCNRPYRKGDAMHTQRQESALDNDISARIIGERD